MLIGTAIVCSAHYFGIVINIRPCRESFSLFLYFMIMTRVAVIQNSLKQRIGEKERTSGCSENSRKRYLKFSMPLNVVHFAIESEFGELLKMRRSRMNIINNRHWLDACFRQDVLICLHPFSTAPLCSSWRRHFFSFFCLCNINDAVYLLPMYRSLCIRSFTVRYLPLWYIKWYHVKRVCMLYLIQWVTMEFICIKITVRTIEFNKRISWCVAKH